MILPSKCSIPVEGQRGRCATLEYKGVTEVKGTQNDSPSNRPTLHNFLDGYIQEFQMIQMPLDK